MLYLGMNIFRVFNRRSASEHSEWQGIIATATPAQMRRIRANIVHSATVTNRDAKLRMLDKAIAKSQGYRGA